MWKVLYTIHTHFEGTYIRKSLVVMAAWGWYTEEKCIAWVSQTFGSKAWIKRGWESMRVCMSVSSTLIARSNEQWELHDSWRESFFFFRFPCFCSLLPRFFFFVFWRLSNCWQSESLLQLSLVTSMIRNIFFFSSSYMGNDLEIACFCNSLRLSCNSHDRSNEPNLSLTLIKIWTSSKLMRVHESWRSNESESCDSHPLSFSFDQAFIKVD